MSMLKVLNLITLGKMAVDTTNPAPGLCSFGASFSGDANDAPAAAIGISSFAVHKGAGAAVTKPTASGMAASGFTAAASLVSATGQTGEYAVGTTPAAHSLWQASLVFAGLLADIYYHIFDGFGGLHDGLCGRWLIS